MFPALKKHPFAVEAFFDSSTVLTFSIPKEKLENLIPECLTLDTFKDKHAFIAIAMVQTSGLRPKGFPAFLGSNFFLIGYRIFVKYINNSGRRLRGLYILKTETDSKSMQLLGNIFTNYSYKATDIKVESKNCSTQITSNKSKFNLRFSSELSEPHLPQGSIFADWREAAKFTGPLPFTFSYNQTSKQVLIIEGVRQNWKPKPIEVIEHSFSFLDTFDSNEIHLANAFVIENVPYYWKKGVTEIWNH